MKITDYVVLSAQSDAKLETVVKAHLVDGWQPLGGIALPQRTSGIGYLYTQAMVKYEEPPCQQTI